jgi:cytochrome c oxidase subunit 3
MAVIETFKAPKQQYSMNPVKFTLWLFLVTITMMFAAFTSAMIVGRTDAMANGTWQNFDIPTPFIVSTVLIVLSSVSMQWAYFAARRNEIDQNRIALWITTVLGMAFVYSQFQGFKALIHENVYVTGLVKVGSKTVSPVSGSFFYMITGLHALHVIGGVIFLGAVLISAYRYKVHSRNMLRINLCTTYWHFIGALWVYLFALLNLYR